MMDDCWVALTVVMMVGHLADCWELKMAEQTAEMKGLTCIS